MRSWPTKIRSRNANSRWPFQSVLPQTAGNTCRELLHWCSSGVFIYFREAHSKHTFDSAFQQENCLRYCSYDRIPPKPDCSCQLLMSRLCLTNRGPGPWDWRCCVEDGTGWTIPRSLTLLIRIDFYIFVEVHGAIFKLLDMSNDQPIWRSYQLAWFSLILRWTTSHIYTSGLGWMELSQTRLDIVSSEGTLFRLAP